jgi:hypothetical protein
LYFNRKPIDHIIPIGVLTPFFPLHFRGEVQEEVIKQIEIKETQSAFIVVAFAE